MLRFIGRYWLLISIIMLAVTGCLRTATDGDFQAPQSLERSTDTPVPTLTPEPSPTEEPVEEVAQAFPTEEPEFNLDDDPFAVPDDEFDFSQDEGIQPVQQDEPTLSENLILATTIVASATIGILNETATAEGPVFELPTATPTEAAPEFEPPTEAPQPPVSGADCVHQVVRGENLFRLSQRYGVPVVDIARASGVTNIERISVNQRLIIPGCGTTGAVPPPTTAADQPGTGGTTSQPSAGGIRHVVEQGETLFQISMRYGVPVNTIANANGISNINLIYLNQELTIP